MPHHHRIVAVVVTHNRRNLLLEALTAVRFQTRGPDEVVLVDNASTDGTTAAVRERFAGVHVVTLERNTGGAGGFAAGVAVALGRGVGLVWMMDDDTVPEPGALAALLAAREGYPDSEPPTLLASRVAWVDGRDHPMNTPREKPNASRTERAAAAAVGCVPIRSASFVSTLVDAETVRERGLPLADYFVWNDDFEFTTRLLRGRRGLYCPASVVVHKTRTYDSRDSDPGERFFYEVRNKVWLFTRSAGLAPAERALYAGSTLRRWVRTYLRSDDRGTLRRGLRRGLAAGLRAAPRPTQSVLADVAPPAATAPDTRPCSASPCTEGELGKRSRP